MPNYSIVFVTAENLRDLLNQCVNFCNLDFIKFLNCLSNLRLVSFEADEENQRVMFFDFLHRAFCCNWMIDHGIFIHSVNENKVILSACIFKIKQYTEDDVELLCGEI